MFSSFQSSPSKLVQEQRKKYFVSMNVSAPSFQSKSSSMVYMEPIGGICYAFQFGKCSEKDHHRGEACLALHICQPCFLFRQNLVDHSCAGGHPNHPQICQQQKFGAIACPSTSLTNRNPPCIAITLPTVSQNQEQLCKRCKDFESHFNHLPAFECNCNMCTKFFWGLQTELNDNGINININSRYEDFHFQSGTKHSYQDLCSDCEYAPAEQGSFLCGYCAAFLKEQENLCSDCEYAPAEEGNSLCGYCEAFLEEQESYGYF